MAPNNSQNKRLTWAIIALVAIAGMYLAGEAIMNSDNANPASDNNYNNNNMQGSSGSCLKEFLDCGKMSGSARIEGLTLANESCDCPKNTYLSQYAQPGNKYCSCWQGG